MFSSPQKRILLYLVNKFVPYVTLNIENVQMYHSIGACYSGLTIQLPELTLSTSALINLYTSNIKSLLYPRTQIANLLPISSFYSDSNTSSTKSLIFILRLKTFPSDAKVICNSYKTIV